MSKYIINVIFAKFSSLVYSFLASLWTLNLLLLCGCVVVFLSTWIGCSFIVYFMLIRMHSCFA